MEKMTHLNEEGNAIMVDVSGKNITVRTACAQGRIAVGADVFERIQEGRIPKGDVLAASRIAGIMAVKKTSEILPLCHPLPITSAAVDFDFLPDICAIRARCTVKTEGKTGVEMEALTGVTAVLLCIYDMCKALSKELVLSDIHLVSKSGGRSGDFFFGMEGTRG